MSRLASKLPKGSANGLAALDQQLAEEPENERLIVLRCDVAKLTYDIETGDVDLTLRILSIEPITAAEDVTLVREAAERALSRRTGQKPLINFSTGEVMS